MTKKYVCCLCGKEFEGFGNNPWPIDISPESRCCDECNDTKVIPERIRQMLAKKNNK